MSAGAPDPPTGPDVVPGSVDVGRYRYTVELGDRDGAKLEALEDGEDPVALAQAIAQFEAGQGTPTTGAEAPERDAGVAEVLKRDAGVVARLEGALGVAAQVTTAIELARELFVQIAQDRPPDVATIDGTVEMLLGLLRRLDLDEHWEEAVRVARELAMLLALLERWIELLQSLQTALRGAKKAKDIGGRAWALHEQGTLQLAAGNHAKADCLLGKAHDLREEIKDRSGLRVTDHNLQVLCKTLRAQLHGPPDPPPPPSRARFPLRPLPALVFALLLLAVGGVAGAIVRGRGTTVPAASVSSVGGGASGQEGRGDGGGETGGGTTGGLGAAEVVDVTAAPGSVPGGATTSEITAKVLNAHHEPLSRQQVRFAVKPEDGTFSSSATSTGAAGDAQTKLTFTSARTAAAVDTVEACTTTQMCGTVRVQWQARLTPIAATRRPSDVTSTGAILNGTLNPNHAEVENCYFEYGVGASYERQTLCASYESSGSNPQDVSAAMVGLAPNTLYRFRLVATSTAGDGDGEPQTFTTPEEHAKPRPTVITEGFSELTSSSVTVMGSVSPSGSGVEKCEFLYAIVKEASFTVPRTASAECSDFRAGPGTGGAAVTAQLSNLAPDQLYDYQLLATVEGRSYDGGSRTFHTEEAPSPQSSTKRPPIVPPKRLPPVTIQKPSESSSLK